MIRDLLRQMQQNTRLGLYEGTGRARLVSDIQRVLDVLDATNDTLQQPAQQQLQDIVQRSMCHD